MRKTNQKLNNVTIGILPKHIAKKYEVFSRISKRERVGRNNCGGVPSWLREKVKRLVNKTEVVRYPEPPAIIGVKYANKIKDEARRMVKKGYRGKPEEYPIPKEVLREKSSREYYYMCIKAELLLRKRGVGI